MIVKLVTFRHAQTGEIRRGFKQREVPEHNSVVVLIDEGDDRYEVVVHNNNVLAPGDSWDYNPQGGWPEAIARRMIADGIEQEERRKEQRRAHPREGYGRRASDVLAAAGVEPFVVAPALPYRVLSGPHAGELVAQDDVTDCDRCDASGLIADCRGEIECPQCGGVGAVLGYPGECGGLEPVKLALVEATPSREGR